MPHKRKKIQVHIYSKGTDHPRAYDIPIRVVVWWITGLIIIVLGFIFWLPDNMLNLKNFHVLEIAKEQQAMQLRANKLEKQIAEANSRVESGHSLRDKINQMAGISSGTENVSKKVTTKNDGMKNVFMDAEHIKKSLETFRNMRDALLKDEQYANSLPLLRPVKNQQNATNKFGMVQCALTKRELPHRGLDFAISEGDTVIATGDGVVENIVNRKFGFGTTLEIQHLPHVKTVYSHLQRVLVQAGKPVQKGQAIAIAGRSGSVLWPVLHYEVHYDNQPVNPEDYFITP